MSQVKLHVFNFWVESQITYFLLIQVPRHRNLNLGPHLWLRSWPGSGLGLNPIVSAQFHHQCPRWIEVDVQTKMAANTCVSFHWQTFLKQNLIRVLLLSDEWRRMQNQKQYEAHLLNILITSAHCLLFILLNMQRITHWWIILDLTGALSCSFSCLGARGSASVSVFSHISLVFLSDDSASSASSVVVLFHRWFLFGKWPKGTGLLPDDQRMTRYSTDLLTFLEKSYVEF